MSLLMVYMHKIELLVPAGNYQTLKYAYEYGADAVYIGGKEYSLRAKADNFTLDEIKESVKYAHEKNKKIYVTVNIFARNSDLTKINSYVKNLYNFGVDAIIVTDPGVIYSIKKNIPNIKIHLSTQSNTTNYMTPKLWENFGIKRIVLARELNLSEIKTVVKKNPKMEFEIFVHGAMCISYSGRCFLSAYMTGRDANRGDCSHPCRWQYAVLEENTRRDQFMYYEEDRLGAYIFNSKDLCLLPYIPELIKTGISSLKIEGRMKTLYYTTCVTRAYRHAIDLAYNKNFNKEIKPWIQEMNLINNRGYTTGFYLNKVGFKDYKYDGIFDKEKHYFYGKVLKVIDNKTMKVLIKNPLSIGDKIDIIDPSSNHNNFAIIKDIYKKNVKLNTAKSLDTVDIILDKPVKSSEWSLIRKI
jgi:U32 family peptidase